MYGRQTIQIKLLLGITIGFGLLHSTIVLAVNNADRLILNREKINADGLKSHRHLRDHDQWKSDWWPEAEKFSPVTREVNPGTVSLIEKRTVQNVTDTSSNASPSEEVNTQSAGDEGYKIYEMMLYFLFVGGNEVPESSRVNFESVTSEHISGMINEKCSYGFRNLIVKVTMEDQFNSTEIVEISERANESTNSVEKSVNTIKAIIYVVLDGQVNANLTKEDLILGSFNSVDRNSRYLTALQTLTDDHFQGIEDLMVLEEIATDSFPLKTESTNESTPSEAVTQVTNSVPQEDNNTTNVVPPFKSVSKEQKNYGAMFILVISFLVIGVMGTVSLFTIRGPLKENLNRFRKTKGGHKIVDKTDKDKTYEVEYVDNCDVSSVSRNSYYSADFHNSPMLTSTSVAQRLKDRLKKHKDAAKLSKKKSKQPDFIPGETIPGPPKEAFNNNYHYELPTDVENSSLTSSNDEETIIFELDAPAGMLGIVVESPDQTGPAVHQIRDTSPFYGQVEVGDKLISVDDEDTTQMSAIRASKLISYKSNQKSRKLIFKRTRAHALS